MKIKTTLKHLFSSLTFMALLLQVKLAHGAERVVFNLSILDNFHISRNDLEKFEKTGEISPQLALYTAYLDETKLKHLREVLQKRIPANPTVVSHFTKVGVGEMMLKRLGELVQTEGRRNGFYALRSALVLSAAEPQGISLLGVLRHFPGQEVRLHTDSILKLVGEFAALSDYTQAGMTALSASPPAIARKETPEAPEQSLRDLERLADLRQTGNFRTEKQTITFQIDSIRQTDQGFSPHYPLEVDVYLPVDAPTPSPLVVISHGFGSYQGNYGIAEHLASYGFAVAVPRHIGSDLAYRESFFRGNLRVTLSPMEFVSRPLDITYLLNELEELTDADVPWVKKIDLRKIGVLGHSLGGSTALSLAGANLNLQRLSQECEEKNPLLNFSLFLQCRALYLPQQRYNLTDVRIKAIALAHPLGSSLFGPEEIEKIQIPTLIVGGSQDIVTPVMLEQVHPFIWLKSPHKYLSLLMPGTHFSSTLQTDTQGVEGLPEFLIGKNADLGTAYLKGLTVAFFEAYLNKNASYLPYLSSDYHQLISEKRLQVAMIRSLTPAQLEQAYQKTPPAAIYPSPIQIKTAGRAAAESIMEELKTTGVFKVAIRSDAPPFGYIDNQGEWTGYCKDWGIEFGHYLETKYNFPTKVEVVQITSNLNNRFELVQQNQVHLECGPNTIRNNVSGIDFSRFFFVTGTQFLVKSNALELVNPSQSLAQVNIGVFKNTTTEGFIQLQYPAANLITLDNSPGSNSGIQALNDRKIDALANDGILLMGEMARRALDPEKYQIIPDQPLTCEYYGIILPSNDPQWQSVVDGFIGSESAQAVWKRWFKSQLPEELEELDHCINR